MKEVSFSDSVISLGAYSFSGNTSLTEVYFGKGINEILYGAFENSNSTFTGENSYCKEWIKNRNV